MTWRILVEHIEQKLNLTRKPDKMIQYLSKVSIMYANIREQKLLVDILIVQVLLKRALVETPKEIELNKSVLRAEF